MAVAVQSRAYPVWRIGRLRKKAKAGTVALQTQDEWNAQESAEHIDTSTAILSRSYFHFDTRDAADRLAGGPMRKKA